MDRLFAYLWMFLRVAERATRQRPSKIGNVFVELSRQSLQHLQPDYRHPEKNREKAGAVDHGIWIGRRTLDRLFAKALQLDEAKGKRLAANLLNRDKSPIAPLSAFVRANFARLSSEDVKLATLLTGSDAQQFRASFGFEADELSFVGIPVIGGGFPRFTVWFGTTHHLWLWDRDNEQRAASLALPVLRGLHELTLSWSPVGGWHPPSSSMKQASPEYQVAALATYAFASDMTLKEKKVGKASAEYLHGAIGTVGGYAVMAPLFNWKQPADVQPLADTLSSIAAAGQLRPDVLLACSDAPAEAVASETHRYHANIQHPLAVFHVSIRQLHAAVRHFPWLWFDNTGRGQSVPVLSSREVDVGGIIRFVCFLDYWRQIVPTAPPELVSRCWREIWRTHDFNRLVRALTSEGMLPEPWSTVADLSLPSFIFQAPTNSPAGELIRQIEAWILANREALGPSWRSAIMQLGRFSERVHLEWDVQPPPASRHALEAYRLAAEGDNPDSRADVAFTTLRVDSVQRGLVLVEQLIELVPARAEEFRRRVLDISEGALVNGELARFAEIVAWPELKKSAYVRPFISQMIGYRKDPATAEIVVRHLLTLGLVNQVVHEISPTYLSLAHEFLRVLVPKLRSEFVDEMTGSGLEVLSQALREAHGAQR